jgi:hypothetical protein
MTNSDTWIAIAVTVGLYLALAGPVLIVFVWTDAWASPAATARAVEDVDRYIELRDQARAELAAGSLDRFVVLVDEARRRRWPTAYERARPPRAAAPAAPPVRGGFAGSAGKQRRDHGRAA